MFGREENVALSSSRDEEKAGQFHIFLAAIVTSYYLFEINRVLRCCRHMPQETLNNALGVIATNSLEDRFVNSDKATWSN